MRHRIALLALLTIALATPARAGSIGAFGSYWDTEDADTSFGYGARMSLEASRDMEFEVRYSIFEGMEATFDLEDGETLDGDLDITPLEAGLVFLLNPNPQARSFISGGASYYYVDSDIGEPDETIGWYAAFGVEMEIKQGIYFISETYYRGGEIEFKQEDVDDDVALEGGKSKVDLTSWGVNLGLSIRW